MNLQSIVAFLLAGAVFFYGIVTSDRADVFFNQHAFFIVIGGSVAAASISFQVDRIYVLLKIFMMRVIRGRKTDYVSLIQSLMDLSEMKRRNPDQFSKMIQSHPDHFLKEAFSLFQEELFLDEELIRVLRLRVQTLFQRHMEEMNKFRTIGKYPPAFGLMGTTLSMISLLQKLGQSGGQKLLGPAMALGLVATFYGLALSNLFFNPISENLLDSAKENRLKNLIIVEGLRQIMLGTSPVLLAEELNSFLLPSERIDWKKGEKS
jgi:chemotaxis protein MotA